MLYDANDCPNQEAVNEELGLLLADTIKGLHRICDKYHLEAKSTAMQYRDSFNLIMEKEFDKSCKRKLERRLRNARDIFHNVWERN